MTEPDTTTPDAPDPLTVQCPDCMAPAGEACRTSMEGVTGNDTHADRFQAAEFQAHAHLAGTCDLCGVPVLPPLGCPAHGFSSVTPTPGPLCPECRDGKTGNCAGTALDPVTDEFVPCATVTT